MEKSQRQIQLETMWAAIRPLRDRLRQRHDEALIVDAEALITAIALAYEGDHGSSKEIATARVLLSRGHIGAALEKVRAILIAAPDERYQGCR
ncbi:MAG: hypothetical protein M3O74_10945 [Pseudomonadota bacterium]|nr:hypothetical protein [Pseudomonadota bacterium]